MLKYQWTDGTIPDRSSRNHVRCDPRIEESPQPTEDRPKSVSHSADATTTDLNITDTKTGSQSSASSVHDSMGTRSMDASSREDICMMMAQRSGVSQGGQNPFFNDRAYMASMMEYYPSQISPYKG